MGVHEAAALTEQTEKTMSDQHKIDNTALLRDSMQGKIDKIRASALVEQYGLNDHQIGAAITMCEAGGAEVVWDIDRKLDVGSLVVGAQYPMGIIGNFHRKHWSETTCVKVREKVNGSARLHRGGRDYWTPEIPDQEALARESKYYKPGVEIDEDDCVKCLGRGVIPKYKTVNGGTCWDCGGTGEKP